MPIDLKELMIDTPELGRVSAHVAIGELVAAPGFAPKAWQSAAPDTSYQSTKLPVQDSEDLRRIIALPRRDQVMPQTREATLLMRVVTHRYAVPRKTPCDCAGIYHRHNPHKPPRDPSCITELNLAQAWALYEIGLANGLLGPIGVGHGKTILDILAPLAFKDCSKAVLLVPVGLIPQLICEYEMLGEHFRTPMLIVHGKVKLAGDPAPRDYAELHRYNPSNGLPEPALHVFPYSKLQLPTSSAKLEEIGPDVIIADEVHNLRHPETARTARVLRYADAHESSIRFAGWSGSLTDASLQDYAHLSALALRYGSPLPLDPEVVEDWSRAIDPKLAEDDPSNPWSKAAPPGFLLELDDGRGGHISEVFHRRLVETSGVVATTTPAVDAELCIEEQIAPPIPTEVEEALERLRNTWQRPDGEELIDALSVARVARELAAGFYYRWIFPRGEPVLLILEWFNLRASYRKELRRKLARREEHLDSPLLVENAARRYHGDLAIPPCPSHIDPREWARRHPVWDSKEWPAWRDIRDKVKPESEAVEVSKYLAIAAAEWALENRGIVWYESNWFGETVAKISGLTKHGGGADAAKNIGAENGSRSIVASIKSHGTGRDGLQRIFYDQLVAQPPSSATTWEQLLGRLHRIGQKAPKVFARFYRHTPELQSHVDQALARALYVQTTLGSEQKLRSGFVSPEMIKRMGKPAPSVDLLALNDEINTHMSCTSNVDADYEFEACVNCGSTEDMCPCVTGRE